MYSFEKRSKEECLEAVKQDGYALRYVKEQDKEICLEAVKQNGYALQYVKEQDKEICLEAVKQDGDALQYVKEYYKEILKLNSYYKKDYIEAFREEQVKEITIAELEKQYGCKVKIVK